MMNGDGGSAGCGEGGGAKAMSSSAAAMTKGNDSHIMTAASPACCPFLPSRLDAALQFVIAERRKQEGKRIFAVVREYKRKQSPPKFKDEVGWLLNNKKDERQDADGLHDTRTKCVII